MLLFLFKGRIIIYFIELLASHHSSAFLQWINVFGVCGKSSGRVFCFCLFKSNRLSAFLIPSCPWVIGAGGLGMSIFKFHKCFLICPLYHSALPAG